MSTKKEPGVDVDVEKHDNELNAETEESSEPLEKVKEKVPRK